jgi:hypothetical protein
MTGGWYRIVLRGRLANRFESAFLIGISAAHVDPAGTILGHHGQ